MAVSDTPAPLAPPESIVPTKYWHELGNGRVQCDLCPRFCKLNEGQRGLCFVRARQDDQIVLTTYGRASGFCVDPIEKKPLNHFYPGTSVLSFGTAGCNLSGIRRVLGRNQFNIEPAVGRRLESGTAV